MGSSSLELGNLAIINVYAPIQSVFVFLKEFFKFGSELKVSMGVKCDLLG